MNKQQTCKTESETSSSYEQNTKHHRMSQQSVPGFNQAMRTKHHTREKRGEGNVYTTNSKLVNALDNCLFYYIKTHIFTQLIITVLTWSIFWPVKEKSEVLLVNCQSAKAMTTTKSKTLHFSSVKRVE